MSFQRPLNKQAGYHITNICLTPLQKVFGFVEVVQRRELFPNRIGWPVTNPCWSTYTLYKALAESRSRCLLSAIKSFWLFSRHPNTPLNSIWPSIWDGGLKTPNSRLHERMRRWRETSYAWIPHVHPKPPAPFLSRLQLDSARSVLSHTSPHPGARPHVFLVHYLKERNVARTKTNTSLLDQTMCHSAIAPLQRLLF